MSRLGPDKPLTNKQEQSRKWHAENPEYGREWYRKKRAEGPEYARMQHLRKYHLTPERYEEMFASQRGLCAICGMPEPSTRKGAPLPLSIDHDRRCCDKVGSCGDCIRGLLCSNCNMGIGQLGDDVGRLQNAIRYLTRRPHDAQAKEDGHPPSARNRLLVDFDATLYPFGDIFGYQKPLDGAVEAMNAFRAHGYEIIIFTSRMSPTWWKDEGWSEDEARRQQTEYITSVLVRDGIPFDGITSEKLASIAYIDDKAIEFKNNWREIMERLL